LPAISNSDGMMTDSSFHQISLTVNVSKLLSAIQHERFAAIHYLLTKDNRSDMENAIIYTDSILNLMNNHSWLQEYGENLKESVVSNLRYDILTTFMM